jgi:hypothetical protein
MTIGTAMVVRTNVRGTVETSARVPHWSGPAGEQPVEILSLLGRQGETHPRPRRATAEDRGVAVLGPEITTPVTT